MRINSVLLNILLLILLAILIYLYLYTNYSTYEKFDTSSYKNFDNSYEGSDSLTTSQTTTQNKIHNPIINNTRDGSYPSVAFMSGNSIVCYNGVFNVDNKEASNKLKNGYYWINLPVVGPRLIYCISDETIFGGGWMLAMRSVVNSKTFNYDSKHWTRNSTLNADTNTITSLFPDKDEKSNRNLIKQGLLNKEYKTEFAKSSIGSKINNTTDSAKYDCKLDTFNYFNTKEFMVIFYYNDINGGDINNNNGWIWKETITETGNGVSLLQLFYFLEQRDFSTINNIKANYASYNLYDKKNLNSKIKKSDGTYPLWYVLKSSNLNFFGFNYEQNNNFKNYSAVRLGFLFSNDNNKSTINGIGLGYHPNKDAYSAGRYVNGDVDTQQGPMKDINTETSATSMSFELYVR